ncbi:hypothetical protein ACSDR0_26930 [Streptosporangium sp. G11]|uniref:hypothetical protein n=1 Tax=Streptosporangium sp. G11 TaxID=3436926 RepID=UPI003EB6FE47
MVEAVGLIAAPATFLTALGFYFGWRRTQTYAVYFGIDSSMLGFSVQEYLLRSATSVYTVVLVLVMLGLLVIGAHRLILHGQQRPRGRLAVRVATVALTGASVLALLVWAGAPLNRLAGKVPALAQVGASAGAVALAGVILLLVRRRLGSRRLRGPADHERAAPDRKVMRAGVAAVVGAGALVALDALAAAGDPVVRASPLVTRDTLLSCGVGLLIYCGLLWRHWWRADHPAQVTDRPPLWVRTLPVVLVALLVVVGIFAATDEYAEHVGTQEAHLTAVRLEGRRGVVVYANKDPLFPAGVTCRPLKGKDIAFRYRCEGLKLLVRTAKGVLVLPATWSRDDGIDAGDRVIELGEDKSMRLEFTPGESDLFFTPR